MYRKLHTFEFKFIRFNFLLPFRAFAGKDAYEMAADKPEILQVLNNPPEVHVFEISSTESSQENLERAGSVDNTAGMVCLVLVVLKNLVIKRLQ